MSTGLIPSNNLTCTHKLHVQRLPAIDVNLLN